MKKVKLRLNKNTHTYRLGRSTKLQSVTQWIKTFFPVFNAREKARQLAKLSWNHNAKPMRGVRYWLALWKKSSDDGTRTHATISHCIETGSEDYKGDLKAKAALEYYKIIRDTIPLSDKVLVEAQVYSKELSLAGTIDLVLFLKPEKGQKQEVIIVDWKTNKELRERGYDNEKGFGPCFDLPNGNLNHYYLQLITYAYLLEREAGLKVKELQLVHLKEGEALVHYFDYIPEAKKRVEEMLKTSEKIK